MNSPKDFAEGGGSDDRPVGTEPHFAALVSDQPYVIGKGRIRFEGTMAALREDEEVRCTYLSL